MKKFLNRFLDWKFQLRYGFPRKYENIEWIRLKEDPSSFSWAIQMTREGIKVYYLAEKKFHDWNWIIENCEWSTDDAKTPLEKRTWNQFL